MGLAIAAYFGMRDPRLHDIVQYLADVQEPDGGWNCRWWRGDTHSSFHTTISALEGLLEYARLFPRRAALAERLQAEGREFLLAHRLFRSHRTGEVVNERMTRFTFPPHWHYDVLRALDYFRDAEAGRDERLEDAIALVEARRQPDGRWRGAAAYTGKTYVTVDATSGPSRWNTLRALRVLDWWERAATSR
jgi:squalene cyclase